MGQRCPDRCHCLPRSPRDPVQPGRLPISFHITPQRDMHAAHKTFPDQQCRWPQVPQVHAVSLKQVQTRSRILGVSCDRVPTTGQLHWPRRARAREHGVGPRAYYAAEPQPPSRHFCPGRILLGCQLSGGPLIVSRRVSRRLHGVPPRPRPPPVWPPRRNAVVPSPASRV